MTHAFARLPESAEALKAFRRALGRDQNAVIDSLAATREQLEAEGLCLVEPDAVPLRPLFVSSKHLHHVSRAISDNVKRLGARLADALEADQFDALRDRYPVARRHFDALDWRQLLRSPGYARWLRPDGFLFEDRFAMSETNLGSGSLYSSIYPEMMYRAFADSPALAQFNVSRHVQRPLHKLMAMMRRMVSARAWQSTRRPRIGLFALASEVEQAKADHDERFDAGVRWLPGEFERNGFEVSFVQEHDLDVDSRGFCVSSITGERIDLVLNIFVGVSALTTPEAFAGPLRAFRGDRIGHAPLVQPMICAMTEKGSLPLWQSLGCWPVKSDDGFAAELIDTHAPQAHRASEYRLEQNNWVLKRSFVGKDTHVGISTPTRVWNRSIARALSTQEYVLQPYERMSVAELPVIRGGRVEWLDFSAELSLFVIEGRYGGGFARVMPAAEGLVMSPPPSGLGLTLLHAA